MGVVYKLKPEVIGFILEQKKNNPSLSCRKLTSLVLSNFKIELSKSSINTIIKEAGLSAPVGRTLEKKRRHIAMPSLPILLEDTSAKEAERKASEEGVKKAEEERLTQEAQRKAEAENQVKLAEEAERLRQAKLEAERKASEEAERLRQAKLEAERKASEEGVKKAEEERLTQEAQRKAEAENQVKLAEEEIKAKEVAAIRAKAEEERLAKETQRKIEEAVRRAKEEAEIFGKYDPGKTWEEWVEEVKAKARLEESNKKEDPKQEELKKAQEEAKKKAREEAGRLRQAKLEAETKAREEAETKAREEDERLRQAKLEAETKAREEDERLRQAKLEAETKARGKGEIKEGAGISEDYDAKKAWEGWDGAGKKEEPKIEEPKKEEPKQEELKKAQEEAETKAREEAETKAREEAETKAREEEKRLRQAKIEEERRRKEEEEKELVSGAKVFQQIENTGIVLLRSAECLIGASQRIADTIQQRLGEKDEHLKDIIENLIYLPLIQDKLSKPVVDKLSSYLDELENIKVMNLDISRVIAMALQEVRCAKVILSGGVNLYLDGQLYSVWSSSNIPYDFSTPIYNFKKYINKYFTENYPFVFFNAPGYDIPSEEFFRFLSALDQESSIITNLVLYGNKFEELETLPVTQGQRRSFIFGLWPWQFAECRKVKSMGEFRKFHFEAQGSTYYIADIEMELIHPDLQNKLALTGCALKTKPDEKTRLVLLSNFALGEKSAEEVTSIYLNHWPNLEEAFQDYSHKIELFTYTVSSGRFFSVENLNLRFDQTSSIKDLFKNYLTALDSYVRWHFLPTGYEKKEFMEAKEQFYNLSLQLAKNKESCLAGFVLPPGYAWPKDLSYACRRINEKEVFTSDGLRLYINPG